MTSLIDTDPFLATHPTAAERTAIQGSLVQAKAEIEALQTLQTARGKDLKVDFGALGDVKLIERPLGKLAFDLTPPITGGETLTVNGIVFTLVNSVPANSYQIRIGVYGKVTSGISTTSFDTSLSQSTTDIYTGAAVEFITGSLTGESQTISSYVGTTKIISVGSAFSATPKIGNQFMIWTTAGWNVDSLRGMSRQVALGLNAVSDVEIVRFTSIWFEQFDVLIQRKPLAYRESAYTITPSGAFATWTPTTGARSTAGSNRVVVPTNPYPFTSADVGKHFGMDGAGGWTGIAVVADGSNTGTTFKTNITLGYADWSDQSLMPYSYRIVFTTGVLVGQADRRVTGFNITTDFLTVSPAFSQAPAAGDTFEIRTHTPLGGTITAVVDANTVDLNVTAVCSMADARCGWGTDDSAAIDDAFEWFETAGRDGDLIIPEGTYFYGNQIPVAPASAFNVRAAAGSKFIRKWRQDALWSVGAADSNQYIFVCSGNYFVNRRAASGSPLRFPLVQFFDLIVDGNRHGQANVDHVLSYNGAFNWQYASAFNVGGIDEDAHGGYVMFNPIKLHDVTMQNISADGIQVARNAIIVGNRLTFHNVFRGGITVVTVMTEATFRDIKSYDDDDVVSNTSGQGGLYMEAEEKSDDAPQGYPNFEGLLYIDNWKMHQGRCGVSTFGNLGTEEMPRDVYINIILRRIICSRTAHLNQQIVFLNCGPGRVDVYDSVFAGGHSSNLQTIEVQGSNTHFHNTMFIACDNRARNAGDPAAWIAAVKLGGSMDATWTSRKRTFNNCTFVFDDTVSDETPRYAVKDEAVVSMDMGHQLPIAGKPTMVNEFHNCKFMADRWREFGDNVYATADYHYRLWDYIYYSDGGSLTLFDGCEGFAKNGFRIAATENGNDNFLTLARNEVKVTGNFFSGTTQSTSLCRNQLVSRGMVIEDRYWRISSATLFHSLRGDLTLEVTCNPTLGSPVQVTDEIVASYNGPIMEGALSPGRGIIAGSITFVDAKNSNFTVVDNGVGVLHQSGTPANVVGAIDYTTGWFSYRAGTVGTSARIKATYQHSNQRPGIVGMLAVLDSNPGQRWRCTVGSSTAATWTVI